MARCGNLVGFNKNFAVWCFGFLPNSDPAKAYGVQTENFVFVCSTIRSGKIKETYEGLGLDLPSKFKKIISWKFSP